MSICTFGLTEVVSIFLLLFADSVTWSLPVTAGGNLSTFFCTNPGCASNVTKIFCNDKLLFSHAPVADCTTLPPPNTVCQHDGRAFVSIEAPGSCDFEGSSYIKTKKCTDDTSVCEFNGATTSSPSTPDSMAETHKNTLHYVCGAIVVGILLSLVVLRHFYKTRQHREQNQHPASDESHPLSKIQQPRQTSVSETQGDQSRLTNGHSPSHEAVS